jgi:hypothetical protein
MFRRRSALLGLSRQLREFGVSSCHSEGAKRPRNLASSVNDTEFLAAFGMTAIGAAATAEHSGLRTG